MHVAVHVCRSGHGTGTQQWWLLRGARPLLPATLGRHDYGRAHFHRHLPLLRRDFSDGWPQGLAHARWQHLCSQPELSVAAEVAGGGHIRIEGGQERLFAQTGMCQGAVCVARVASE